MNYFKIDDSSVFTLLFDLFKIGLVFSIYVFIAFGWSNEVIYLLITTLVLFISSMYMRFTGDLEKSSDDFDISNTNEVKLYHSKEVFFLYLLLISLFSVCSALLYKYLGVPYNIASAIIFVGITLIVQEMYKKKTGLKQFNDITLRFIVKTETLLQIDKKYYITKK